MTTSAPRAEVEIDAEILHVLREARGSQIPRADVRRAVGLTDPQMAAALVRLTWASLIFEDDDCSLGLLSDLDE